jgi:hypothetical protein
MYEVVALEPGRDPTALDIFFEIDPHMIELAQRRLLHSGCSVTFGRVACCYQCDKVGDRRRSSSVIGG